MTTKTKDKTEKPISKAKQRELELKNKLAKLEKWEGDLDVAMSFPSGMAQIRENQEATQASLLHLRESIAMNRALLAPKGAKGPKGGGPQDVRTPGEFFLFLEDRFNAAFAIDLAATNENALCPRYFSLEEGTDSLQQDWKAALGGEWGYLNPPYGHVLPWVRKARLECERGARFIMLLRSSNGKWFMDNIYQRDFHVLRMYGRMVFPGYGGDGSNFDTQIIVSTPGQPYKEELWSWKADMEAWSHARKAWREANPGDMNEPLDKNFPWPSIAG